MILYRVTDWEQNFENNRTRELKHMDWVPIPNKMDGDGYTELLSHPNGAAHFGAWMAIVEIASKCTPRGVLLRSSPKDASETAEPRTLLRDGARPHDSRSLSRISRIAEPVFNEVLPRLVSNKWLTAEVIEEKELMEMSQAGAVKPHRAAEKRLWNGTERKNTEGKNNTPLPPEGESGQVSAESPHESDGSAASGRPRKSSTVSPTEACEPRCCGVDQTMRESSPPAAESPSESENSQAPGAVIAPRKVAGKSGATRALRKVADEPEGFVNFWVAWPDHFRKKGRSKCAKIWERKNLEPLAGKIVDSVERHKKSHQWNKDGGNWIPLPASWLNDDAWDTPLVGGEESDEVDSPGFQRAEPTPDIVQIAVHGMGVRP